MDYATTYYKSLEVQDAQSFGAAVADFAKYGITGSVASGALGLANTGIAFANMLGADIEEYDLAKTLDDLGMRATAEYARENETLVGLGGLVAGSIVPGFLGVKALHKAQKGLEAAGEGSRVVTGIRAALVPRKQVDMMAKEMFEKGTVASNNSQLAYKAAKQGFHQQMLEAAFAETAILLTMNQHTMLNDQDLDYLDSMKANLDSLALGIGIGGVIGGAASTVALKSQMQNVIKGEYAKVREVADAAVGASNLALNKGDVISLVSTELHKVREKLSSNPTNAFEKSQLVETETYLENKIGEISRNIVKESTWAGHPEYAGHLTKQFTDLARNLDAGAAVNNFAGLKKIKSVSEQYTLFEPRATAYGEYSSIEEMVPMVKANRPDLDDAGAALRAAELWESTYGFAYTHRNNSEVKVAVLNGNVPGVTEDHMLQTLRHELGHVTGANFAQIMDTKYGKKVRAQMEEVSRAARPEQWATVDRYELQIAELDKMLHETKGFGNWSKLVRQREAMLAHIRYMRNPDELIADNLAMFTSPEYEKFAKAYPKLDAVYRGNALLKNRMRETEVIMDLKSGNLTKQPDRIPTIADMGRWEVKGGQLMVSVGAKDFRVHKDAHKPLDITKDTPEQASAKFLWAKLNPLTADDIAVSVGTKDFAGIYRVMDSLAQEKKPFRGKVTVEDFDPETKLRTGTRTFDFSGAQWQEEIAKFRKYATNLKVSAVDELARKITKGTDKVAAFSWSDIARLVDAEENWARYAVHTRAYTPDDLERHGKAFWSETYDPRTPTQAKMVYDRDLGAPTTETEVRAAVDVKKRIDMVRESAALQITSAFKEAYENLDFGFPPPRVVSGSNRFQTTTQADPTQGAFRAQQGDYLDDVEFANAVGNNTGLLNLKGAQRIAKIMEPAAHAMIRSPEAMVEYAVSSNKFRQYKMEEIPAMWTMPGMDQAGGAVKNWFGTIARSVVNKDNPSTLMLFEKKMEDMQPILQRLQTHAQDTAPLKTVSADVLKKLEDIALSSKRDRDAVEELSRMLDHELATVRNPQTAAFWKASREANQSTVKLAKLSASLRGKSASWNPDQFYPGPLDRTIYKKIAFVKPKVHGLMGDKEFGIIGGADEQILSDKLALLRSKHGDNFEVITDFENAQRHKQLLQDYEEGLVIDSFYFDNSKLNKGVAADIMPDPNPQLVWAQIEGYKRQMTSVHRNLVKQYYDEEWQTLESYEAMRLAQSADFGTKNKEASVYQDRMATMLNMPNDNRFGTWRELQRSADKVFSTVWNTVVTVPLRSVAPSLMDVPLANYQEMNAMAKRYGFPEMYTDNLQDYLVTSMKVDDQLLANIVPRMNWLGATLTLRLDLIQPVINAISLPILANPEMKHLIDALPALKKQQVVDSLNVVAKDKAGKVLAKEPSNLKLMQQATINWFKNKELRQRYKAMGIIGQRAELYMGAVEEAANLGKTLTTDPRNALAQTGAALKAGAEFLSKFGDATEDYVRFVAADMARQVLEGAGIKGNVVDMAIQTYVNRVSGNYHYAQRPGMFQGWAGQAVGLFQTYQFNLIQQMLRHLGDKPSRAAAMMGLQTGIFGLQSTPGFELLNNHVAERSKYEGDFYTGLQDMAGNTTVGGAGVDEWILYGFASNFTRPLVGDGIDLFSRGNLNPRSPIIIPSSIDEVPVVSMATKFVSSMGQAADNLAGGVPVWDTFTQALATHGINRPLQGIGQLMAGERITSRGSTILSTDDLNWWQSVARVAGARGMDEAVAVAHYYRAVKYESARQDKLNQLGQVVKAQVNAGNWDGDAYSEFMQRYAAEGGDIDRYNKWAQGLYQSATQSQIYDLYNKHDSMEGRYLQQVMGGGVEQYINPWNLDEQ